MTIDPRFTDSESAIVGDLSQSLVSEYIDPENDPWAGSPFAWIKTRPSRQIGAIGERLVTKWALSKSFTVRKSPDSDADRIIQGHRVEIKFSTLWAEGGIYKFQQIRDQDYEYCFCMGVSPFDVHAWFIPKSELLKPRPGLSHQHGGVDGIDTMWLSFAHESAPSWLAPYGGRLSKVETLILAAGKGQHVGKPLKD
jgi:hypothetical protein